MIEELRIMLPLLFLALGVVGLIYDIYYVRKHRIEADYVVREQNL